VCTLYNEVPPAQDKQRPEFELYETSSSESCINSNIRISYVVGPVPAGA